MTIWQSLWIGPLTKQRQTKRSFRMYRPEQSAQSVRRGKAEAAVYKVVQSVQRGKTEGEAYLVESSQGFRLRYCCESSRKLIK